MKSFILGGLMLLLLGACSNNNDVWAENEREKYVGEKIFHELGKQEFNVVADHIVAEGISEEVMIISLMIRPPEGVSFESLKQNATDAINQAFKENDIKGFEVRIKAEPEW